jgi:hypothetical protein
VIGQPAVIPTECEGSKKDFSLRSKCNLLRARFDSDFIFALVAFFAAKISKSASASENDLNGLNDWNDWNLFTSFPYFAISLTKSVIAERSHTDGPQSRM